MLYSLLLIIILQSFINFRSRPSKEKDMKRVLLLLVLFTGTAEAYFKDLCSFYCLTQTSNSTGSIIVEPGIILYNTSDNLVEETNEYCKRRKNAQSKPTSKLIYKKGKLTNTLVPVSGSACVWLD